MNIQQKVLKEMVAQGFEAACLNPAEAEWSLQGFGMLRCYLGEHMRVHVWDDRYRVPDVTLLHNHPWDFESLIVAGEVSQYRYRVADNVPGMHGAPYVEETIQCGPGGFACNTTRDVLLHRGTPERYYEGETYKQDADEVHESLPANGTVTIIDRTFHPDTEHAQVYYLASAGWVSAEPRPATPEEVRDILGASIDTWFTAT